MDEFTLKTFTGKNFNYLKILEDDICIEDIAHSLSFQCRGNGHLKNFYSVAQHCIFVGILSNSLEGLLHDASEAYTGDIPTPLKKTIPEFKILENKIQKVIYKKYNIIKTNTIKSIDILSINYELNLDKKSCWKPKKAENIFLKYFNLLKNEKN